MLKTQQSLAAIALQVVHWIDRHFVLPDYLGACLFAHDVILLIGQCFAGLRLSR
jgi:hypothetical protein